jgi:hypothetical protein
MMMAAFRRLDPSMRGSVTFDNDTWTPPLTSRSW